MSINKEKLNELRKIFQEEYGFYSSEKSLLNEAIRLSEFAKTIINSKLKENKYEKQQQLSAKTNR
jgi:inosine/xanthosine triphosphate pyrophosphatase family protein